MREELEYEFSRFKQLFDSGNLDMDKFFDEDEYEDEYSHNEIDQYKREFIKRVRQCLHENAPGKYIVSDSWCVFVMTVEEAKKRNLTRIDDYLVM